MILRDTVRDLLDKPSAGAAATVYGWVRTARKGKNVAFAVINDGSTPTSLQAVFNRDIFSEEQLSGLATGACVKVVGRLIESPGAEQSLELEASTLEILGPADGDYPLQKKRHTNEFLRTIPHLRPRTNTFSAAFRMSHHLSLSIHRFFDDNGFYYVHAPVITSSDAEGAGEAFRVTSLPLDGIRIVDGRVDHSADYFGREAFLTVSAQLEAEPLALALGKVYTFGPTFRADPSDTRFHAAEFWMIEPEMAFFDLEDDLDLIERFIRHCASDLEKRCPEDIAFFTKHYDGSLPERFRTVLSADFHRVPYTEAMEAMQAKPGLFDVPPVWGMDISPEYERFITGTMFDGPVFVTDYPRTLKPFYARANDDGHTVACADLLFPGIGEIVGASQREERLSVLRQRAVESGIDMETYEWYFDLRRWGSAPHSGFGLGFERLLMYFTGLDNIRDVIPFPRTMGRMT